MLKQVQHTNETIECLEEVLNFLNIERGLCECEKELLYSVEEKAVEAEDFKLAYLIRKLIAIQGIVTNGGMPVAKQILNHVNEI